MKASNLHTKHILAGFLPTLLFSLFCAVPMTLAVPAPPTPQSQQPEALELPKESLEELYNYEIENRPDPFVPFISAKSTSTNNNEIVPVAEQLSGMQLFEPGQLNLVAIVLASSNDFAMAEDTTGKGYILHKGMKIGKRGVITDIQTNEILIEETAFTRAGKKLTSKVVMLLKKEGEE